MTSKTRYSAAVGLAEDARGQEAPAIAVSACGLLADEVVKTAIRYGVPVVEDPEVARALLKLELDHRIPEELFAPVAVVLARLECDERLADSTRRRARQRHAVLRG